MLSQNKDLEAQTSNEVAKMKDQASKLGRKMSKAYGDIEKATEEHISKNMPDLTTSSGVIFTGIIGCAIQMALIKLYNLMIPSSYTSGQIWTTPEEFANLLGCYLVGVVSGWHSSGPNNQLSWQQTVGASLCSSLTTWATTNHSLWVQAASWNSQTIGYFVGLIILSIKSGVMFSLGAMSRKQESGVITAPAGGPAAQNREAPLRDDTFVERSLAIIYDTAEDRARGGAAMCVVAASFMVFCILFVGIWALTHSGETPWGTVVLLSCGVAPLAAFLRLILQSLWNYQIYPCPWGTLVVNLTAVTIAVCAYEFLEGNLRQIVCYGVAASMSTLSSIMMEVVPKLNGRDSFNETAAVYIYVALTVGLTYLLLWV